MNLTDVIDTPSGKIQGLKLKSHLGVEYSAFYGIPYAKPPIGTLRFCRPETSDPWSEILIAKNKSIKALQNKGGRIDGQEDCLYLNIYTSANVEKERLPVMLFIHGGAFQFGDGGPDLHGPDCFMDEAIILVSINYRLGPIGFLTLQSTVAPGNLGLWDQKRALEWVRNNISEFGGDPKNVTIFGESAGAMSCMMHLVSPQSAGLFHKVIAQSGTFWHAYEPNFCKRNNGKILASKMGLDVNSKTDTEILSYLQNAPLSEIIKFGMGLNDDELTPKLFLPCIDDYCIDSFFPEDGLTLLEKGKFNKVPLLHGTNRDEGLLLILLLERNPENLKSLNENWKKFAPKLMFECDDESENIDLIEITKKLKKFYLNDQEIEESTMGKLAELSGDKRFNVPIHLSSKFISESSDQPIYRYVFDHEGKFSLVGLFFMPVFKVISKLLMKKILNIDIFNSRRPGVNHGDEMIYLFKNIYHLDSCELSPDNSVRENMVKLWTSFALSGQPSHTGLEEWRPYNKEHPYEYYRIGEECKMMISNQEFMDRLDFWIENIMGDIKSLASL